MTRRGRPPAVQRYLWDPIVWPLLALAIFGGFFVFEDLQWSRPHELDPSEEALVVGTAVDQGGEVKVRYRHPVTEQVVVAPLWAWDSRYLADPGEEVRLIAQKDDPLSVQVEGDRFPLTENLLVYGLWVLAASVPFVGRRFSVWRTRRLAAGTEPTFAMAGALTRSGLLGRCHLQLFALDAPAGAEPVCSVRVLNTAHAPLVQRTFPVEVKGSPRPLGRVVAQTGGVVLWPAGRALGRRRGRGRPATVGGPATRLRPAERPAVPWTVGRFRFFQAAVGATLVSAVLFGVVSVVTLLNASRSNEISREGLPAVGEVTRHEGDDDIVVLRYQRNGVQTARARVDFASDYPVGIRYPIRLDPDEPETARLVTEPYDVAEPHIWAAVPLLGSLVWLLHRLRTWRRARRVAANGPWWHAHARQIDHDGDAGVIAVASGDDVLAGVPVGAIPGRSTGIERTPLIVAGDLDPGGPAALWWDGIEPVASLGGVTVPDLPEVPLNQELGDLAPDEPIPHTTFPLRTYRLAPRKAHIAVGPGEVSLFVPGFFGRRRWTLRPTDVAAVDLTAIETEDGVIVPEGVVAPYLPTTSPMTDPTLMLLFKTPQRVPPIRLSIAFAPNVDVPFGYLRSRSEEGEYADGVLLRAPNAAQAVRTLVAAGADSVIQPAAWISARRPRLGDSTLKEGIRRTRWLRRVGNALMVAGWAGAVFGEGIADWLWAVALATFALGLATVFVARRLEPRARPLPDAGGPRVGRD